MVTVAKFYYYYYECDCSVSQVLRISIKISNMYGSSFSPMYVQDSSVSRVELFNAQNQKNINKNQTNLEPFFERLLPKRVADHANN